MFECVCSFVFMCSVASSFECRYENLFMTTYVCGFMFYSFCTQQLPSVVLQVFVCVYMVMCALRTYVCVAQCLSAF